MPESNRTGTIPCASGTACNAGLVFFGNSRRAAFLILLGLESVQFALHSPQVIWVDTFGFPARGLKHAAGIGKITGSLKLDTDDAHWEPPLAAVKCLDQKRRHGNTMNTLGIIGGLSWASTQQYYRLINEEINRVRGRQASAELLIRSINFQPVIDAQVRNDWNAAAALLCDAARDLERGGAKAFLIASNTMHLVYDQVHDAVEIPGLNIFDATAAQIHAKGLHQVGLLGTRYTMNLSFFREEYARRGIDVIVPEAKDAARVNEVIFKELIHNQVRPESQRLIWDMMAKLHKSGADGVILGCTELELLMVGERPQTSTPDIRDISIFDTTALHAMSAAQWLIGTSSQRKP